MSHPLRNHVKTQLRAVRALSVIGLNSAEIAQKADLPRARVRHLLRHYADRPLVAHLTPGLARDVREAWALGQYRTRQALATEFDLTLGQLAELSCRVPPAYLAEGAAP